MAKKKKQDETRELTKEELLVEEQKYLSSKKWITRGWHLFACASILYFLNGMIGRSAIMNLPQEKPIIEQLDDYRDTEKFNDYMTAVQNEATDRLMRGEITVEEYNYVVETVSSDENFEKFLRSLEDDERVQKVVQNYDKFKQEYVALSRKHSGVSIVALSSLLVSTLILGKHRFREESIEEARKKRAEAKEKRAETKEENSEMN